MRPRVTDKQIEGAIAALYGTDPRWPDGVPGVREVARALREAHGHAGTNQRICSALNRVRTSSSATAEPSEAASSAWRERAQTLKTELAEGARRITQLEQELATTIERAERAEAREIAHQDHYQVQIYELRQQLKALDARRPQGVDPDVYLSAKRELHAALAEIDALRAWCSEIAPRRLVE